LVSGLREDEGRITWADERAHLVGLLGAARFFDATAT
jgi:hypothetical protein